jgi:predicted nucleic acid-binding protein
LIVLDASAVLELLLNTTAGQRVAERIRPPEVSLHAPYLLDVEVTQVLRRYVHSGALTAERGRVALGYLAQLDVARYGHEPFLQRMWTLRHNLTAYDAVYVALAEALEASLLTFDRQLADATGIIACVELLTDG